MGSVPDPRPLQRQAWRTVAAGALPLLVIVLVALLAFGVLTAGSVRVPGMAGIVIFVLSCVVACRFYAGEQAGQRVLVPSEAGREAAIGASGFVVGDRSPAVHRSALSAAGSSLIAPERLPQLEALVAEVSAALGVAAPQVLGIALEPWTLTVEDGTCVFGAGGLATASVDELRAQLAYELWFTQHADELEIALHARRSSTFGNRGHRGVGTTFGVVNPLAASAAAKTEHLGLAYASGLRAEAMRVADALSGGPGCTAQALQRELAAMALWPEVIGPWQRHWMATGEAVRPFAGWAQAVASAAAGHRVLGVAAVARIDALDEAGWPAPDLDLVACPQPPPLTALAALGGEVGSALLNEIDDAVASAYYDPWVMEVYGSEFRWDRSMLEWVDVDDGSEAPVAAAPLSGFLDTDDPPLLRLLERQLEALRLAQLRPDAAGLAVAQAIERAPACLNVGAAACGIAWLCGDAEAATRLPGWLQREPACAGTLSGLMPALRTVGLGDVAQQIEAGVDRQQDVVGRRLRLAVLGAGRRLAASTLPIESRRVLDEAARRYPGQRAWIADAVPPGHDAVAPLLVVEPISRYESDVWLEEWGPMLRFAIPGLTTRRRGQLDCSARWAVTRRGIPLAVPAAPARPFRAPRRPAPASVDD